MFSVPDYRMPVMGADTLCSGEPDPPAPETSVCYSHTHTYHKCPYTPFVFLYSHLLSHYCPTGHHVPDCLYLNPDPAIHCCSQVT